MYNSQQQQQQQQQGFSYQPPQQNHNNVHYDPNFMTQQSSGNAGGFNRHTNRTNNTNHYPHPEENAFYYNPSQYNSNHPTQNYEANLHTPQQHHSHLYTAPPPHVVSVGVHGASPISRSTSNTAGSPRPFGAGSAGSGASSYNTTPFYQSKFQESSQPVFETMTAVSSSSAMPAAQSPPAFQEHMSPRVHFQPQAMPQSVQQQQQHYHQQQQQYGIPPQRSGFLARILNFVVPYDATEVTGNSQTTAPLYQTRFGFPEDDLPLLEELGILPGHIRSKAASVLNPFKSMSPDVVEDMDLAGPLVFAITLAFLLSLRGKMQFSAIYGHSVLGIVFTKVLLSLMAPQSVPLQFVISSLGYCLIPNVVLAMCLLLMYWVFGYVGRTMMPIALIIVAWSAWCATAMLVNGLSMEKQRYLIMYPMFLFYAVFAALTIF